MATVKWVNAKKGGLKMGAKMKAGDAASDFVLVNDGTDMVTVSAVNANGDLLDISAVATLTPAPVSSDPTIIAVDPPVGMTYVEHAVGPLSTPGTPITVTIVATWNDGSKGPFTFVASDDVVADPNSPTGITIVHGPVVTH
jgi:hypothetical protein